MKKIVLISFLIVSCFVSFTQQVYYFTKGLAVVTNGRYGRQAVYTDPLAHQLYNNQLKAPVEGTVFSTNDSGQVIKWQPVIADSANRFSLRNMGSGLGPNRGTGYFYFTYSSAKAEPALLNIQGANSFYFNGEPHAGDPYASGWLYIPVYLKKGINEIYIRGSFVIANLRIPGKSIFLNTEDATLPHIVLTTDNSKLLGAVVVFNTSNQTLQGLQITGKLEGKEIISTVPSIPPRSTRKITFAFDGSNISVKGKYECSLSLMNKALVLDETKLMIEAVGLADKWNNTFVSHIDGSLQYYAVTPQIKPEKGAALFLSVHGAGVEAIGQARAYQSKDWGTLVAPTNRRPRGFNWEDWGRLDALEVLNLAKEKFQPDPQKIYLTGHSMGGHGTWFLGATYPDKWAAIAPCAGYPTLMEYGSADGLIPATSSSPVEQLLLRSSNQSDVLKLVSNYKPLGVYIFHGDADRVVPVRYARQMKKILADFHPDLSYYEYPGGEHWFGDQSVDWTPMFDFFKWHKRAVDSSINTVDFMTANPGISSGYRWITVYQQIHPLQFSRVQLTRNRKTNAIYGTTENVRVLKIDLTDFDNNAIVSITLDSLNTIKYTRKSSADSLYLRQENKQWVITDRPSLFEKGPHRNGTFKDPFNNNMLFVYSSKGTREENEWSFNKARYDAETWYYRGNGAVDIIPAKEDSPEKYKERNIIIYGNASTNSAYRTLLSDCPVQIDRNSAKAGTETWSGDDLGAYFVWPVKGSATTSVGVIAGTGLKGMKAANANQYFAGASGFPDIMIFRLDMLKSGSSEIKMTGFFDNTWKLDAKDFIQNK